MNSRGIMKGAAQIAFSALVALFITVGCEDDDGGTTGATFVVSPSSTTMYSDDEFVVFQAVGGTAPYVWSVSDTTLGSVSSNSGATVSYSRTGTSGSTNGGASYGVNTLNVVDANGWKASATITQTSESNEDDYELPVITPDSHTLSDNGGEVVFTASKGDGSYSWSVGFNTRGRIESSAPSQCTYTRLASGDNTVTLTDGKGHTAVASISQPETAALAVSPSTATVDGSGGVQVFTASGGNGVYTWYVHSGDGSVAPSSGSSTVYTSEGGLTTVIGLVDHGTDGNTTVFATITKD